MKNKLLTALLLSAGLAVQASNAIAAPPSTAFTYQGSLSDAGSPANGPTSISFRLWDAVAGGNQVGSTLSSTVDVVDGVFSESLDFGAGSFADNQALWLEILVEGQSLGRTPISATPFALNTRGITVSEIGRVGIGTSEPAAHLQILTPNWGNDIRFRDDNSTLLQLRAGGSQGNYMNFSDQGGSQYLGLFGFNADEGFKLDSASGRGSLNDTLFFNYDDTSDETRVSMASGNVKTLFPSRSQFSIISGEGVEPFRQFYLGHEDSTVVRMSMKNSEYLWDFEVRDNNYYINSRGPAGGGGWNAVKIDGEQNGSHLVRGDVVLRGQLELERLSFNTSGEVDIAFDAATLASPDAGWQVGTNFAGYGTENNQFYIFENGSGYRLTVQRGSGNVGIGTENPTDKLHVAGSVQVDSGMRIGPTGFGNVALNIDRPLDYGINLSQGDAGKPGGGSWANTSDIRLKKNITPIEGALDTLLDLRGVHFEYKDPKGIGELEGVRTGFIAQEVEKVISDWVWDAQDGYKRMTIRGFEAMSVEAMRELKAENDDLRQRVEALEAMVHAMLLAE